jgi:DNA-binding LacI/PurR family transcriptional regulator
MGMGHTQIAIITGPLTLQNEQERLRGYRQALQKGGIPVRNSLIWSGSFEQEQIARVCQNGLLRPADRPSALFATNGVTGLAALRSLYAVGLSTPKDFSFVTFDEVTAEDFFRPGITSVVQPTFDMGYQAVEVLLKRRSEESARKSPATSDAHSPRFFKKSILHCPKEGPCLEPKSVPHQIAFIIMERPHRILGDSQHVLLHRGYES